jgi:protein gp37
VFHARVGDGFVRDLFEVMAGTPQHTYQVLTKRPDRALRLAGSLPWPRNVWLGVSAEDQRRAEFRIPVLLRIPAAVRFVSLEPLLGPIDLKRAVWTMGSERGHGLTASFVHAGDCCRRFHGIDWVITGGESGPGARPMHPTWALDLRDSCTTAGIPFFFKQWGEWVPGDLTGRWPLDFESWRLYMRRVGRKAAGRLLEGRTWDEMPPTTLDQPLGRP